MAEAAPAGAWRAAAALACTQTVHWGSLFYAFSVLMPEVSAEMGWSRGTVVGAFSAGLLVQAVAGLGIGPLLDRLGPRGIMAAGSVMASLGLLAVGQSNSLTAFYLAWCGIGVVMAATLYEAAFTAIAAAFGQAAMRPGIALVTFAGGLASTVFWPLTAWMVEAQGWREACQSLALLNLLCAPLHALLLPGRVRRQPPTNSLPAPEITLHAALRGGRFWALAFVNGAVGLTGAALGVHLVPLLEERSLGSAAPLLAGLMGVAQLAGRVAEFYTARRLSLGRIGVVALVALALAGLLLGWGQDVTVLGAGIFLYGLANGIMTIVRGGLPARFFGTGHYGAISSALAAPGALMRAAGPWAAGWLWQIGGSYAWPMTVLALIALLATLVLGFFVREGARTPPR
ncbi:MFS transporter [Pseudoroseomonas globiformis]|uniref:MFS transporter n=1 Tax=Teichococcus globiformis TaxID=2307229 RepID=A0ABV7G452_9PROT